MVSPLDLGGTKPVTSQGGAKPKTRLPPLKALKGKSFETPMTKMLEPNSSDEVKRGTKTRTRSRSPAPVAHNRFHYKCCDDKTTKSIDDIKAQSLQNVAKRRKSRLNGNGITNGTNGKNLDTIINRVVVQTT